jgi:aspartate aminotransferase-like enzyme
MGYTDELDVVGGLAALEMVLSDLGLDIEPGIALTAAQQVLLGKKAAVGV